MRKGGYTILELIFYIALFTILTITVVNSMIIMTKAFRETSVQRDLSEGGSVMERISREARMANDISSISSSDLKLNTTDNMGAAKTVEFVLTGSDVQLLENNILTGNLNTPDISLTGLSFTQITSLKGKSIKIFFTINSTHDLSARSESFYDTVVLRGNYQ